MPTVWLEGETPLAQITKGELTMKIWLACTVKVDNGLYAYAREINDHASVNLQMDSIAGLEYAHLCPSKRHACELVKAWNDSYKANGTFAYSAF